MLMSFREFDLQLLEMGNRAKRSSLGNSEDLGVQWGVPMTDGAPINLIVPSLGTTNTRAASDPPLGCCVSDVIEGMLGEPSILHILKDWS